MRDTIELELRGVPVALITATARLVDVNKRNGVFEVAHAFATKIAATMDTPWAAVQLCRFGIHRALRLAGCREGDAVRLGDSLMHWCFPDTEFEANHPPAGFGRWNSTIDGLSRFKSIVTPDPIPGLDAAGVAERVGTITGEAISILMGGDRHE